MGKAGEKQKKKPKIKDKRQSERFKETARQVGALETSSAFDEIVAAMAKRMTVRGLAAMPHYHPTLAEIWTYPAEELADRL